MRNGYSTCHNQTPEASYFYLGTTVRQPKILLANTNGHKHNSEPNLCQSRFRQIWTNPTSHNKLKPGSS